MSDNNYGSRDVFFSLTADLGPEDDPKEVQQALFEQCHQMAMSQFERGKVEPPQGEPDEFIIPKKDFWDSPAGERIREVKAEQTEDYGLDNGPRGSKFEG